MTTLLEFFNTKKNTYAALRDDAQNNFSAATENLANAQANYDALQTDFAALEKQVKEARQALTVALMPADIEKLAKELRVLLDQSRNARADLLAKEEQIAVLKNDMAQAFDQLQRAKENLKEASKELLTAKERQKNHDSWNKTVVEGVLSDLATDAATLLDVIAVGGAIDPEDPLAKEKNIIATSKIRVTGDIPEKLLERALERGQDLKDYDQGAAYLLADLKNETGDYWESAQGTSGKVMKLWIEFLKTEEAYKKYVLNSQSQYDQALALFTAISKSAALTDAEKCRITDTDLVNDGEAALLLEKALDDAKAAVDAKEFELELAIAKAMIADISADPGDNPDVQTIRSELESLHAALLLAEDNYTDDMQDDLDLWEASIPDHIWANAVSYDQAIALLTTIRYGNPASLAMAMDNAESALVEALKEQDIAIRTRDYLEDVIDALKGKIEYKGNKRQQRLLSAIRGD
ncbi:hypothetical protein [Desulfogranum marinum]|uniref:hypothetical protein n=1 Tax=Desulfogranum marinum TaxID=453220 RepID=UPI0029C7EBDD|nr:hypothetical protein [Desulfogranum marinum]